MITFPRQLFLIFIFLAQTCLLFGQSGWSALSMRDAALREDVIATEQVLDLVQAVVIDSSISKDKQRLKGVGGWIAQRAAARYWLQLDTTKRKYIGTSSRPYKIFSGLGDEYDVNIFLMPHLPPYVKMAREAFDLARKRPRGDNGFRFDTPENYPLPEELKYEDRGYFTVECEITPSAAFRPQLDSMLMPMSEGPAKLEEHPNFGQKYPSFGTFGVWCMDCNHNCRPEIHPIEWLWWLDMSEDRPGGPDAKSWLLSLMFDDSKRFNDWSQSPIEGQILIPFSLPANKRQLKLKIDQLMADPIPLGNDGGWMAAASPVLPGQSHASISHPQEGLVNVEIEAGPGMDQGHLKLLWFPLKLDEETQLLNGYVMVFAKVKTLMALRMTFDH